MAEVRGRNLLEDTYIFVVARNVTYIIYIYIELYITYIFIVDNVTYIFVVARNIPDMENPKS